MNSILDNSLVGLALIFSAGYAAASLGPRTLRSRLLGSLSRAAARAPALFGLGRLSGRLAAASAKTGGACGGCESCGSSVPESPDKKLPAAEIRVPVAKIRRRI